ncbi:glutamate receptor ionotropic, delta-1-like [Penaeus monodon]|uniref:glutamate receptor ionotropic, delta-1-like n=1 Tax=Penaeus monodon TaxID=6687 RepID=UPI0018A764C3|nr:glutamate receptor ionotropic, delta-1-like [Penaeus monodon]
MSMVPMSINHIRNEAVDFSETLFVDEHRITFKRPVPEADITGFVKPFTPTMWVLLLLSTLLMCAVTFLIQLGPGVGVGEKTGDEGKTPTREPSGKSVSSKLRYAVLWTLSCLFSQSVPWEPRNVPVRVVTGMWLLATLIVGTVYRSNLKAMLILPKVVLPFETFEEFAEVDIRGYIILGGILDVALRGMEANSTLGRIRDKSRIDANIGRGLSELIEGKTAPIASTSGQRWEGYCRMYSTRDGVFSTAAALGFPKGSPLKPKIDAMIRGLKEFGILQYLFQKEVPNSTFCFRKPVSISPTSVDLRPLELGDFYGVFCLYAGGILLAALVFTMERFRSGDYGREAKKRVQNGWNGWRKVTECYATEEKVFKTVLRPAVLYGMETLLLTKRKEDELEVAEIKMFGDKDGEARLRWFETRQEKGRGIREEEGVRKGTAAKEEEKNERKEGSWAQSK